MYFSSPSYSYDTNQYYYSNVTAISDPKAPIALANAIADVLFLPHSAVSINSFTPVGYIGGGNVGGYANPSTTATVTVLYQGTGLIPTVNAISDAFNEATSAVSSQEKSPLGNALIKYNFPNTNTLSWINFQTSTSKSYTAGQPTPAPIALLSSADIAAEGIALCSLCIGRTPFSGWSTGTGCYYNTSMPLYQPPWCTGSWYGVSCDSSYSVNYLYLYYSQWVTGFSSKRTIPTSIGGLKGLTYLSLYDMGYTGPIPSALFTLTKLNSLYLQSNALSGLIPTTLANLKQLQALSLDYNRLNGTLPAVLLHLPQLNYLSLQGNSLRGTIPSIISKNTVLQQLYLDSNQFIGSISKSLVNLTNLQSLGLSNNAQQTCEYTYVNQNWVYSCTNFGGFNGTLPAVLYRLKSLNFINLISNSLTGTLSPSISALSSLQTLLLSGNKFSKSIPSSISVLQNLQNVYLDSNRFSGRIPKVLGNILQNNYYEYTLLLHDNYLSGALPSMPYSYPQFIFTFDQNCQLSSAYPAVILTLQSHCKPGNLIATADPSRSPTPCKDILCRIYYLFLILSS